MWKIFLDSKEGYWRMKSRMQTAAAAAAAAAAETEMMRRSGVRAPIVVRHDVMVWSDCW